MVELVLDIAWEKIESIEAEKMRKAAERRVPLYSNPNSLIVSACEYISETFLKLIRNKFLDAIMVAPSDVHFYFQFKLFS